MKDVNQVVSMRRTHWPADAGSHDSHNEAEGWANYFATTRVAIPPNLQSTYHLITATHMPKRHLKFPRMDQHGSMSVRA